MENYFKDKRVFVTGACGSIGKVLIEQLIRKYEAKELIGIDNNESELFFTEQNFEPHGNARFFLADVRDKTKISKLMKNVDIIFHTAAFKHVILCERSPFEAVQTNIIGVQNIISAAIENNIPKVVFTSSDKAVNPTSVMGTSKLMGERLITAANQNSRENGTCFISTRFGNVLGSRGSVIPIFREQIRKGGPLTLTDPSMTRFIMSIKDAVRLVIESATLANGGEVFITKMPVIRIKDLAEVMISILAPDYGYSADQIIINTIGTKPGEKMYEELMNNEETRRSIELSSYYVVRPAFTPTNTKVEYEYPNLVSSSVTDAYNSENVAPLSKAELAEFLQKNELLQLESSSDHPAERFWPDIDQ